MANPVGGLANGLRIKAISSLVGRVTAGEMVSFPLNLLTFKGLLI
jgi:hypothetical protein